MKRTLLLAAAGLGAAWGVRSLIRRQRFFSLQDRTVLITGGSRGLGLVLARQLVREGARLVICARDEPELKRAFNELAPYGPVLAIPCDVTDQDQVARMVQRARDNFGHIHVLINNAG